MAGEPTAANGGGQRTRARPPRLRAVIGAALITAAAGGVIVAHRAGSAPPATRWLVVTGDVSSGHALTRDDLGAAAIDLPSGVGAIGVDRAEEVVGRRAAHRLADGDLLRSDDLLATGRFADPAEQEVTVSLEAARAPAGSVHTGDLVRVLATPSDGEGTRVVAERARVVSIEDPEEGQPIGGSESVTVVLAAPDARTAVDLVDAAVRDHLTVVLPSPGGTP